ncbi:GNAT family N-acetyltransferase [Streptomyces globisporus]|uniref:GNAT family N-acetyltransferase n=1 Tax=Streptomyces globisporus TaxID=1908 RepID=UPI0036F86CD8
MHGTRHDTRLDVRHPWSATLLTGTAEEGEQLSAWMRQEYLVRTWNRVWPADRWIDHFRRSAAEGSDRPFLITFEGRAFACVEVYLLRQSVLAPHADWAERDLGLHLAVIDPALTHRGLGTRFLIDLTAALFRQSPATTQVVAEPDVANTVMRKALRSSGYRLTGTVRLPDKTAAIMRCPRPPAEPVTARHDR